MALFVLGSACHAEQPRCFSAANSDRGYELHSIPGLGPGVENRAECDAGDSNLSEIRHTLGMDKESVKHPVELQESRVWHARAARFSIWSAVRVFSEILEPASN